MPIEINKVKLNKFKNYKAIFPNAFYSGNNTELRYKKWGKTSTKDIFKSVFGRQLTTKIYTYKCWVWSFTYKQSTVFALIDKRGAHFEHEYKCETRYTEYIIKTITKMVLT